MAHVFLQRPKLWRHDERSVVGYRRNLDSGLRIAPNWLYSFGHVPDAGSESCNLFPASAAETLFNT